MMALVTGATGFVGSAVARALVGAGWQVRALVRAGSDRRNLQQLAVDIAVGDLADGSSLDCALADCPALFHLAADYRLGAPEPEQLYRTNVEGTRNILSAARRAGVSRVVYTSSVATIGLPADGSPGTEATPVALADMIGHYKRSKFLAEQLACQATATGMSVVIVNPSTPIGPGDVKPTPTGQIVVDAASGRLPAYVDTGLNIVHVDDVAAGHLLAFHRGRGGERYILGGEDMTLREILAADCSAGRAQGASHSSALCSGTAGRLCIRGSCQNHRSYNSNYARRRAHGAKADVLLEPKGGPRARLPVASADAGVRGRRAVVSGAGVAALITIETNGERREITSKTDSPTFRPARGAQCRRAGHAKRSGDGRGNHVRHCDIRGKRSHARSAQGMAERGGLSRACDSAARDVARRRRGSRDRQRLHAQTGGCAAAT